MSVVEEQNTLRQRLGFATTSQDSVAKPGMSSDSYINSIPNTAASYTPTHKGYVHKLLSIPDTLLSSLSTISFPPAIAASRMAIISMMSVSITWGQLRILTADQGVFTFPVQKKGSEQVVVRPEDRADIRVIRNTFWFRLVVLADLGFAEAYMAGDCEVSDLVQVFKASHFELVMIEATTDGASPDLHSIQTIFGERPNSRSIDSPLQTLLCHHLHHQLSVRQHHFQLALQHQGAL
jgi:cyclopropane-fatty-acyl-phospholipid synthase